MKHRSANPSPWIPEGKMLSVAPPRVPRCAWADEHAPVLQGRGKWFLPRCLCWDAEPGTGVGIICGSQLLCGCRLPIPCAVSNLLTQPCLPPTPSRYLHLPLSNHFFLWLLKLTHFDILRGEKWEVLLEIALMCCAGEALLEEQAQNPLWALFYLPLNNISLFYFKQKLMWVS